MEEERKINLFPPVQNRRNEKDGDDGMTVGHQKEYGTLDQIRVNEGAEQCKKTVSTLLQKDAKRALALINDPKLLFPCLYVLYEPLQTQRVQRLLNRRNLTALRIANQIKGSVSGTDYLSANPNAVYPVLKWILQTGCDEEVAEDDYEEILDVSVSVLINKYKDAEIVPQVVDLIFRRNRAGSHIHDLVWALFRYHDPEILRLIAPYLRSSHSADVVLAEELLNLDNLSATMAHSGGQTYERYVKWLEENQPYLYFTDESFQYTSRPLFCCVDIERKYLQQQAATYEKQPLTVLGEAENACIAAFRQLREEEQLRLADYSQTLRKADENAWKEWLQQPVQEQAKAVKRRGEGAG